MTVLHLDHDVSSRVQRAEPAASTSNWRWVERVPLGWRLVALTTVSLALWAAAITLLTR